MATSKSQRQQNKNITIVAKALAKENKNLTEDMDVLKSVIHRLNKEMAFYKDKPRVKHHSKPDEVPIYTSSGPTSPTEMDDRRNEAEKESDAWLKEPRKKLQPLLAAYDEIIQEKDRIIKIQETALELIKTQRHEIGKENDEFRSKKVVLSKPKGSVSKEEWSVLYDNAALVLEQNDLLSEQVIGLKKKIDVGKTTNSETVTKLNTRIKELKESQCNFKTSYSHLETHCAMLTDQISKMTDMIDKRIPREDHESSVYECKRLFEDLKLSYNEERIILQDKNSALEKERQRLVEEGTELETKNGNLQEDVKALEETILIKEGQIRDFQMKLQDASKSREATSATVNEMMELAQAVISERESLEKALQEQICVNERMMLCRSKETELVAELQGKSKIMNELHQQEMDKLLHRCKELEKLLESIGDRHREETSNLKEIISEKSKRLELIEAEKRQLEIDLGTVWLASKTKDRIANNQP